MSAVRDALAASQQGSAEAKILVAFSGGLDSTALLDALQRLAPQRLVAAHVNHGLQEAAQQFEHHCREFCDARGIALVLLHPSIEVRAGDSVEARARQARYAALAQCAQEQACSEIWTAHHRDDQVESLLLALGRGADLAGLVGIAPRRTLGELALVRPLLKLSRSSISSYARTHGLLWIDDPSNAQMQFRRNRLRATVIPALEDALPGFGAMASRSMERLQKHLSKQQVAQATGAPLTRTSLLALPPNQRAEALRAWLSSQGLAPMGERKLLEVLKQCTTASAYGQIDHCGLQIRRYRDGIDVVGRSTIQTQPMHTAFDPRQAEQQLAVGTHLLAIQAMPSGIARLCAEPSPLREPFCKQGYPHSRALRLWCQALGIERDRRRSMHALVAYSGAGGSERTVVYVEGLGVNQRALERGWQVHELPSDSPL